MKTISDLNLQAIVNEAQFRDDISTIINAGKYSNGDRLFLNFFMPPCCHGSICQDYDGNPIKFYMGQVSPDVVFINNDRGTIEVKTPNTYEAVHHAAAARLSEEISKIETPIGTALYVLALSYIPYCISTDSNNVAAITNHPLVRRVFQSLMTNLNDPQAPLVDYDILDDNQNKHILGNATDNQIAELLRLIHMTTNPRSWPALLSALVFVCSPTVMASSWRIGEIREFLSKKTQPFQLQHGSYSREEVLDRMLSNLMFILRSSEMPYNNPEKAQFSPGIKDRLLAFANRVLLDHEEFCELADLLIGYMCCAHSHNSHVKYHFALLEALD